MNMEASRWWLHLAKAGDLEVVVGCAGVAERERDRIGSSAGGSGRRGRRAVRRRPVVHRRVGRRGVGVSGRPFSWSCSSGPCRAAARTLQSGASRSPAGERQCGEPTSSPR